MPDIKIVGTFDESALSIETSRWSLDELRIGQDYGEMAGGEEVIASVPVRKPGKQAFFRVRAGDEWKLDTYLFQFKSEGSDTPESRAPFIVPRQMRDDPRLVGQRQPFLLHTYIDQFSKVALWPIRLPGPDGKDNEYWSTARRAAKRAETDWVRIEPHPGGGYRIWVAESEAALGEPQWPSMNFRELLELAFEGRWIDSPEHIVIRKLRGLA